MAVAYVGAGPVVWDATGVTVLAPTGFTAGNLLVMVVCANHNAIATPAGWTLLDTIYNGFNIRGYVFYRIAQSGDSSWLVADAGIMVGARIFEFSGQHTTTPIDTYGNNSDPNGTSHSATTITTTVAECMVGVAAVANNYSGTACSYSGWTNANLTALTERADDSEPGGDTVNLAFATGIKSTAGATDATNFTSSVDVSQVNIVFAIRPSGHNLTGNACKNYTQSTTGSVVQTHIVVGAACFEKQFTNTGLISQIHKTIAGTSCLSAHTTTTGIVTIIRNLTGSNCVESIRSTNAGVWENGFLAGSNCQIDLIYSNGVITQIHPLTGDANRTLSISTTGLISQQHGLTGSNCNEHNRATIGNITQVHKTIVGVNCVNAIISTSGLIDQSNGLLGSNCRALTTTTFAAITQIHKTISGARCFLRNRSTSGASPVVWDITGADCTQWNESTAASFYFQFLLVGADCTGSNISTDGPIDYWLILHGNDCVQSNLIQSAVIDWQLPLMFSFRHQEIDIVHVHQPHGVDCNQSNISLGAPISQTHKLVGANCNSTPLLSVGLVEIIANVRSTDTVQRNKTTKGRIYLFHYLEGVSCFQKNKTTRRRVKLVRTPTGAHCTQKNKSGVGRVIRLHDLSGINCIQVNIIDGVPEGQYLPLLFGIMLSAIELSQTHYLAGLNCKTLSISTNGNIEQPVLHGANCVQRNFTTTAIIHAGITLQGALAYQRNKTKRGKIRQIQTSDGRSCNIKHRSLGKAITQRQRLTGADCTQVNIIDGVPEWQLPLLLGVGGSFIVITQVHKLRGAACMNDNLSNSGIIAHVHKVRGADCNNVISTTNSALTQNHELVGSDCSTDTISSTGYTYTPVMLVGNSCAISSICTVGVLTQIAKLRSTPSVQVNQSVNGEIVLVYTLDGVNVVQINLSSKNYILTQTPSYPDLGVLGDDILRVGVGVENYLEESH